MKRTTPYFLTYFFLFTSTLLSQEYAGKLEGRILDIEGIPIILADISISSQSMQGVRKTLTNKQGCFYAFGIPVGNYTININHISKQNVTFENIIVNLGKTTSLGEVILKEEVSEIQEVVVSSAKPIVDDRTINKGGVTGDYPNPIMYAQDSLWIGWWAEKDVRVHNRVPSIFLQDSWLATNRLRINSSGIQPEVADLKGQYFDEFILGFERRIGDEYKIGIQGIYRNLGKVVEDGEKEDGSKIMGNPGKGELDFLPKFTRDYAALEITFQKPRGKFNFLASYILSRNYGNYPGVFDSDIIYHEANLGNLDLPIQLINATGLLPNDKTHLFKIFGSYNFDFGLTVGTSFILQSGTPLNEYGPVPGDPSNIIFHAERGSAGRTPTIWDWNIRLSYDLGILTKIFYRIRILVDVFHLFSRREAVLLQC